MNSMSSFWQKLFGHKKEAEIEDDEPVMQLIIGLGNPEGKYKGTRHNIGFEVINKMAFDHNIPVNKQKYRGIIGTGKLGSKQVALIKPLTYMNRSGDCVRAALDFYKLSPADIIVVVDDVNLPVGEIRIRERGSAGGQNGLRDIIEKLSTDEFIRIRVGIGSKPPSWKLSDYVLSKFLKEEYEAMVEGITKAGDAAVKIVLDGTAAAMNQFNKKGVGNDQ